MPYQNFYQNPYYQQAYMPQQQQQVQPQTIQNGGYVTVRSEDEARNYPVAPGNSMTFFNETQPYCYKKTMSFSPLDHPTFERYRIVKEETPKMAQNEPEVKETVKSMPDDVKAEIEAIKRDLDVLKDKVKSLTAKTPRGGKKDDAESE